MVKENYIELLSNPEKISSVHTKELEKILTEYPYFQSAYALYLKALKNQESFKYNNKLKLTAAHTTNRTILFNFITSKEFNTVASKAENKVFVKENLLSEVSKAAKDLQIGKPLSFNKNETHSFQQWLQLATHKPVARKQKTAITNEKDTIINRFIKSNPKISKLDKTASFEVKLEEKNKFPQLMTETLAKVYLEQKKYNSAIKAYEILSLKYPEKSGFFADQIKQVRILQKTK